MKHLKKLAILATVAVTALLVATVAFGAPGDDGSAKFCSLKYGPHKGEVRLMDSSATACHTSEQSVTLATAASVPTPQPAPKTTTEFAVIRQNVNGGDEPPYSVFASSGGVSILASSPNMVLGFGHSLAECAMSGSRAQETRGDWNLFVDGQGNLRVDGSPSEWLRVVVVCNA